MIAGCAGVLNSWTHGLMLTKPTLIQGIKKTLMVYNWEVVDSCLSWLHFLSSDGSGVLTDSSQFVSLDDYVELSLC